MPNQERGGVAPTWSRVNLRERTPYGWSVRDHAMESLSQ